MPVYIREKLFLVNGSPSSTETQSFNKYKIFFQLFLGIPSQCISNDDSSLHLTCSSYFRYLFLLGFFLLHFYLMFYVFECLSLYSSLILRIILMWRNVMADWCSI